MASLFGTSKVSSTAPVISSLRVQTSCNGKPIPLLYGMPRVAINVIQYEDFQSHAHTERAAGGKGGSAPSTTSYTYTATLLMALGQGAILSVRRIWKGKEIRDAAALSLDVYTGTEDQTPFPHIAAKYPERALTYPGIAYLAASAYDLGANAQLENHTVEVETPFRIAAAWPDCDPSAVITDLITHPIRGLGMADALADLGPFWAFCRAHGIWVSPAYTEQKPAREMIQKLIDIGFADAVYSQNKLKIVPYSDVAASGNGADYVPNRVPVYELTEDDFLTEGADAPIRVKRKHGTEAYNHVQVKFYDRARDYNEQVAEDTDPADVDLRGKRTAPVIEAPEIADAAVASRLASFKVRRSISERNAYEFTLPWKFVALEPTDLVLLTLPAYGFDRVPVMIDTIEESDEAGGLQVVAEDYALKSTGAVQVPTVPPSGYLPDFSVDPGNANIPVLFEPPLQLTDNRTELWLATAGGENWGGAEVYVSMDNATYKRLGRIEGPSRHGSLRSQLPAGAAIDTAHLLQVDLSASRGQLLATTQADAESLVTLCYVDGEYLAYADANLTGVNTYDLGYLVRGAYGSDNKAHAAGTAFVRLDGNVFRYSYPKEWVGKTVWIKLVSFNRYGSGIQQLAEVPAYARVLEGAPLPAVKGLRFEQPWIGAEAKLAWDPLDGAATYEVEVQAGAPSAVVRLAAGLTSTRYAYGAADMRADGGPWRTLVFRVRARASTGRTGPWAQLLATNPQVGPLTGLQVEAGMRSAFFRCERPDAGDFAGILVWIGTAPDFPANDTNLAYDGADTFVTLSRLANCDQLAGGTKYFIRAAGYDTFGKDSLSVSAAIAVDVAALAPDASTITEQMIKDGALTNAKFAQDLTPIGMVGALPNPVGYTGPEVVLNTADGKLYRLVGGAWKRDVDGSDIAPGSVDGAKFAQGIEPVGVVASLPNPTGYTGPKMVLNQADGKTYRLVNGAWKKDVDAGDIAGQLQAGQIAAGAIDLTKMANGLEAIGIVSTLPSSAGYTGPKTVLLTTDGKLYRFFSGGWVRTTPTSDLSGTISANQIAANAVTAGKIATDAVTAGTIAAGAISAREIAAGAITAGKLVVADTTNLVPDADLQDAATTWPSSPFAVVASPSDMPGINSFYTNVTATTPANSNLVFQGWCQFIPIEPNTEYRVTGWVKSDADATGTLGFYFHQFGADKLTDLGASAGGGSGPTMPAAAPRQLSYTLKTGPNARFLRVRVRRGTVANGGTCAGQVWASLPSIVRRANAEMLVDGAITTAKLAAGAVTTNELAAGAVSADKLQANAVTAGKIAAGAVSADQIAAGALSIGKFGAERWSLQKSFGVDGSDVAGWMRVGGAGTFETVTDNTAITGGAVLRVTGYATLEWKDNIPFDPAKLYKITVRVRQTTYPTSGGRQFYLGFTGVAADGSTRVSISGTNSVSSQHYAAASGAQTPSAGEFVEYVGYVKGLVGAGETATANTRRADAASPGAMHANVRFIRPLIYANYNNGNGVADLDSFQIDMVEIPANSVGVTHIQNGAISTDKLQANSITASKLVLADTSNLVPDADMQDAAAWVYSGTGPATIVASPSDMPGINCMYQAGSKTAAAGSNFLNDSLGPIFPLEPNTEYRFACTIKTSADATGTWRFEFLELDSAKTIIRYNTPGSGVIPQAAPYRSTLTVKTLANTKYLRVRIRRGTSAVGGTATGELWASMPSVVRAANAELIVDGAVTAGKIGADAVTAGTVAAGAINTRELAAGAVTTDKLVVGNFDNQIPNGDFASGDLSNWRPFAGTQSVVLGTDASVPVGAPTKYVMRLASAAAGRSAIFSHAKAYADAGANMDGIRVTAGQQYDLRFKIVRTADATAGTTAYARFNYLRKDGTTATGTTLITFAGGVAGIPTGWTEQSATFIVPATTPEIDRAFLFFDMSTGFTAGSVFVADVRVTRVSDATLIADGAVTTQKLVAAAVTADKVAANAITADKLVANAMTADKLAANAVTAAKIAAGAVTADHLMVGQSSNMFTNPGFEGDWYGWSIDAPYTGSEGTKVPPDDWALAYTTNKTAYLYNGGGIGNQTVVTRQAYQQMAVEPGRTYMLSVYSGAHRCKADLSLAFYNSSGTYLAPENSAGDSTNDEQASGGKFLSGYKRLWLRGKAPAGAAFATAVIRKYGTRSGTDSWLFFARPYFGEVQPNQTTIPAWDAAGATTIGPGSLKTGTLSAITANLGDITAGTLSIADATRDNFVRSGSKWWADGQQGWILARQAGGGTFFDMFMGNSRIRMSSWGDCAITFPNFSIDNAGNLYCRGDIQANSLTANIVNTPHLMYRSVSDMAYAYYLYGREAQGRLYFTLNYDSIVLLSSGPSAGATMRVVNANTGGVIAGGMNGQFVGFALGPGYYFYGPEGDSSNAYYVTVIVLKR